ncbi:MAG TPA: hypothetical protein VMW50_01605 [Dehalococcoidia bacterium]|nr:hypothetical protein [Dehalococcoidia bacterium]
MDASQFQQDKEIDPSQLDVECVRQSDRFFHWSEMAVEAGYRVDRAKLKLDVTKARLEMKCRQKPANFGLIKATESGIEAAVLAHEDYYATYRAWLDAKREQKMLDAAVASMESKRRMLDNLIRLHGQQYFAGPSTPHDLVGSWKGYQERLTTSINDKQKSKARLRKRREQ